MAKYEIKTKLNDASVKAFLDALEDEVKREDCYAVSEMMQKATKAEPKMWGSAIVGFGSYHYQGKSSEGEWMLIGFSPRKANITLYIGSAFEEYETLAPKLGKYKVSGSCLHIKKLADVDTKVLQQMIKASVAHRKKKK